MTIYLIIGTERGSTTVEKFGDVTSANTRILEIADDAPTWLVTCAADLATKPGPLLVKLHNALAPEGAALVKKFETRTAGAERLFRLLEGKDAPGAAAPPTADTASAAPTQTNEDDMATKGKKAARAKKAPRVKKVRVASAGKDDFGLRKGSNASKAASMFARASGSTMAKVKEELGDTFYGLLGKLQDAGHKVKKDGKTIFLTAK